mmetsp:Transcript_4647/g.7582  ORF Transcript_4647/g.7582 Transcript_4647/m.7582 type:complete len:143 (-) Transcript_4647:1162-1590(-)
MRAPPRHARTHTHKNTRTQLYVNMQPHFFEEGLIYAAKAVEHEILFLTQGTVQLMGISFHFSDLAPNVDTAMEAASLEPRCYKHMESTTVGKSQQFLRGDVHVSQDLQIPHGNSNSTNTRRVLCAQQTQFAAAIKDAANVCR